MPKSMMDALKTRLYTTSTLTNALGSRIFLDEGPANAARPLLVYSATETQVVPMFGGVNRYDITVEFAIAYENSGTNDIWSIAGYIETAMSTFMSATGFDRVRATKVSGGVPSFENDGWTMTETYRLTAFDT
jgi:hypothetical protein